MSLPDHLNHTQLRLFLTADELMDHPAGDGWASAGSFKNDEQMYDSKLNESKLGSTDNSRVEVKNGQESLYDSISKNGVIEPVVLDLFGGHIKPTIDNGHHRIAAAYAINPNMYIPIKYRDD